MSGLIRKDLYAIRTTLIFGTVHVLLMNLLVLWAWGDISSEGNALDNEISGILLFAFLNIITILVYSTFMLNTLHSDIQSGWNRFQRTIPLTPQQISGAKLTATYITVGYFTAISLGFNIAAVFLLKLPAEQLIAFPLCIGCFQVMTLSPVFPISLRIGAKRASGIYTIVLIIMAIVFIVTAFLALSNEIPAAMLRVIFYGVLPLLAAVSGVCSFKASSKCFARDAE